VELTGSVLSLRDASAARLAPAIERGEPASVVAYEDLGPEALYALELDRLPAAIFTRNRGRSGAGRGDCRRQIAEEL